jgi:5-methylcytosine-specific restriction endonuclease McrA
MSTLEENFINLYSFDQKKYHEIESELNITRQQVQELYNKTRYRTEYIQNIRDKFKGEERQKAFSNFREFFEWYEAQEQKCGYCGISQQQLHTIFQEERLLPLNDNWSKNVKGTLQIERINSKTNSYEAKNIILACPLCNNAKSNLIDDRSWCGLFAPAMTKYYNRLLEPFGQKIKENTNE